MPALYELTADMATLEAALDTYAEEHEGDLSGAQAVLDALELTQQQIGAKAGNCVRLARSWEATAEAKRKEAALLLDGAKALEAKAESLKSYVVKCLGDASLKEVQDGGLTLKLQTAGGKQPLVLHYQDPSQYPAAYVDFIPTLAKDRIREALAAGQSVPGAELAPRKLVLRVK